MGQRKKSFEKINYSLRPGKCIERKMLCEALRYLSFIQDVKTYKYIGFGSTYFTDFILFHKGFGINDMISIEKEIEYKDRFLFNKPYSCIDLEFGDTNDILPIIDWNKLSIVWLDYDYKLNKIRDEVQSTSNMFQDIETFFFKAKPGSVFIITVDVKPDYPEVEIGDEIIKFPTSEEELKEFRMNKLIDRIGLSKVPVKYRDQNLNIENNTRLVYEIINNEILEIIKKRNFGQTVADIIEYKQLFHFLYNDGTLMLSVGGLIYNESQKSAVDEMMRHINSLDYFVNDQSPYRIEVPLLTFKEIMLLDTFLPNRINKVTGELKQDENYSRIVPPLPLNDKLDYSKIYKYFPTFAEMNF